MKKISIALLLMTFVSCTKQTLTAPGKNASSINSASAISYKDNSISVIDFKAAQTSDAIEVGFTTLFEKNIVSIEILRGHTATNLCSIYKENVSADSYAAIKYITNDIGEDKSSSLYYMVKYTLANGDWGYTPAFKLSL